MRGGVEIEFLLHVLSDSFVFFLFFSTHWGFFDSKNSCWLLGSPPFLYHWIDLRFFKIFYYLLLLFVVFLPFPPL